VHESDISEYTDGVVYVQVADSHKAVGQIACNFYDNPSAKFKLIGTTGTNGKTTTTTLLHQLFRKLGYKVGMIGTVVNKINDQEFEAVRTTPDAINLQKLFSDMVQAECSYVFMEVSSHAVSEGRLQNVTFAGGVFTNLTHDHLDYHGTFDNYRDAKKEFFNMLPAGAFAITNSDDANGIYMVNNTKAQTHTYGFKNPADFSEKLESELVGEFNMYNILAVYATASVLKQDSDKVKEIIKTLDPAPGRFESIANAGWVTGIVDYAHTPDAVENVLKTVRDICKGKMITVIGCGGDRDKAKRPTMARIAYDMSDMVILTSDNPRSENPADILNDMQAGITNVDVNKLFVIVDRHEAIQKACSLALAGDYIAILGKGHEDYQEVNGVKTHFSDMEELKKFIK
jgi:UDP-N-acetylmuramoyl-L-alanyl-D-glutamate--2,6-diaminopimelate ligase